MSTSTPPVKHLRRKPAMALGMAAPASLAPAQTALVKRTPDITHARKKRKHIVANVNVGWGNSVYLRGNGGALSWDLGVPMTCLLHDQWVWSYFEDNAPREIKFLRNDTHWAMGENHLVIVEKIVTFMPQFP